MAEKRYHSGKFQPEELRKGAMSRSGEVAFQLCNNDPTITVISWALNNGAYQPINPPIGQTCNLPNVDPDCIQAQRYELVGYIPGGAANTVIHLGFLKSGSSKICGAHTQPFTTPNPPDFWIGEIQNGTLQGCGQ